LIYPAHPHRFAFCPSAPLRQAVLRTSSWLAPSVVHRPTLRSTGAEDARCVQPTSATQTTCVHPHLACSRFSRAGCPAGRPHGVLGSVRLLAHRGTGRFTTSKTASADRHRVRTFRSAPHGLGSGAWAFSSHGARAIEPLTPLSRTAFTASPLRASPELLSWPRVSLVERLARVGRCALRRDRLPRRLVKGDASVDPGCLLSAGILRGIRWPLQPRSRDRRTTFRAMLRPLDGTLAPPWIFVRCSPVHSGEPETPTYLSLPAPNDGLTRRLAPRARPPFTRPCRSFWSAFAELIRGQTPPDDFCNYVHSTCGQPNPGSSSSHGRWPRPPSVSHAPRLSLRSGDARRAARRPLSTTPVLVPPACAGLPNRDASEGALQF